MKKFIIIISIIISPYLLMVVVNEYVKTKEYPITFYKFNIITHNDHSFNKYKCTWSCHHQTSLCKKYHINHQEIKKIDFIYNKIIEALYTGGSKFYAINNIIFLVLLWPLWMLYLFIRIIY